MKLFCRVFMLCYVRSEPSVSYGKVVAGAGATCRNSTAQEVFEPTALYVLCKPNL